MRKLALSTLESWLLRQLEEAGAEELLMLVNVARRSRDDVEAAVRRLLELSLVELAWAERGWPRVDEAERAELSCFANWVRWEPNGAYWALAEGARSVALVRAGGEPHVSRPNAGRRSATVP